MAKKNKANKKVKASKVKAEDQTPVEEKAKPTAKEAKAAKAAEIKAAFEAEYSKPSKSKAAIAKAIVSKELQGAKSSIEIGGLLAAAKFYFPKSTGGVDAKAWLAWSEEEFDYKKAQANNLVKIHAVFAENEALNNLKPTILIALTRNADMCEAATEAVAKGEEVDNKWVTAWRAENLALPAKAESADSGEESEGGESESSSAKQREKDDKFIQSLEDRIEELEAKLEASEKALKKANKGGSDNNDAAIAEAVEAALAEAMTKEHKAVANRMAKQAPHIQLGVKEGAAARAVNQAVVALDKIYGTKSDTPSAEIMELVKEAQAALKK